jgi:signal transduction histidine kinase
MSFLHPDLGLLIAASIAAAVLLKLHINSSGDTRGFLLTFIGILLFWVASFFNYLEETPYSYIMLALTDEAGWNFIVPMFGYAPGGLLVSFGFFEWFKTTRILEQEIVQRRLVEKELKSALISASRSNAAKKQFLSSMSHEMRTPLTAVIGFADIMADPNFKSFSLVQYREYSEIISKSAKHLLSTIEEILNLADLDAENYSLSEEIFIVEQAVNDCLFIMSNEAELAHLKLTKKITGETKLMADLRLVKQIVINLISNAIQYSPANASITCSVSLNEKGQVAITVEDTGVGMQPGTAWFEEKRLSETSDTFSSGNRGYNLDLVIADRYAKLHDATVDVVSSEKTGSKITITFPKSRLR